MPKRKKKELSKKKVSTTEQQLDFIVNEDNTPEFQNVQRLNEDHNQNIGLKVFENFIIYDESILNKRQELINLNKTKGNNRHVNEYKQMVPAQLCPTALSWCVGLVLGDASIQRNSSKTNKTCRLKIQQALQNKQNLDVTLEILKPYVFSISHSETRPNMYSIDTIQHEAFNVLADLFQNPEKELDFDACVEKIIPENIENYLDPIALSSWFCSDGGKADYTANEGKGIHFHTQGFSLECNERLAQALRNRYSWNTRVVFDYTNNNKDFYLLQIDASSFNSVEKILKPYILDSFLRKFPSPRRSGSRFLDS